MCHLGLEPARVWAYTGQRYQAAGTTRASWQLPEVTGMLGRHWADKEQLKIRELVENRESCLLSYSTGEIWPWVFTGAVSKPRSGVGSAGPSRSHRRCELGAGETLIRQFCLALSLQRDAPPTPRMCLYLKLVCGFCHAKAKCGSPRESFHVHHLMVTQKNP